MIHRKHFKIKSTSLGIKSWFSWQREEGKVGGEGNMHRKSCLCIWVKQPCKVKLKQLIQESNQIRGRDVMGPTPGSRAMGVTEGIPGWAEESQAHCGDHEDAVFST